MPKSLKKIKLNELRHIAEANGLRVDGLTKAEIIHRLQEIDKQKPAPEDEEGELDDVEISFGEQVDQSGQSVHDGSVNGEDSDEIRALTLRLQLVEAERLAEREKTGRVEAERLAEREKNWKDRG